MFTLTQVMLHVLGDYVLQSDWMAAEKTKRLRVALIHAFVYTLPFLLLTLSWQALIVIWYSHALIDHYRLARYVCYVKNFLAPRSWWHPWSECRGTGYHRDRPPWLATWLLIITDNAMHVTINALALYYFA